MEHPPSLNPTGTTRSGIIASLAEGAVVGVMFNVLEQWMIPLLHVRLGVTTHIIFLLTLVPLIVNVLLGPWVGRLIPLLGGLRSTSLGIGVFQSICLALLVVPACHPGLPGMRWVALTLAIAVPASMAVSQPAWFAWTGSLVPRRLQGRYFGTRNRLQMTVKLCAAVGFASIVSIWPIATDQFGVVLILLCASATRLLAVWMLARCPPPARTTTMMTRVAVASSGGFRQFLAHLLDSHFGRWNIVWSTLFFGFMVAGPAFSPYMLTPVSAGGLGLAGEPVMFTALVISCQVMRLIAYPLLGWIVDRIGPTLVLRWGLAGITIVPINWAFVQHVPTLIAVEVVNGLCWCAAECAAMVLLLGCHRDPDERARLIGYHQTLLGLVQIAAVGLGLALLPVLPPLDGSSFRSLFLVSVCLRIPAAVLGCLLLPRLPVDVRQRLRGLWRELPGLGLVATTSRGMGSLMRWVLPQAHDADGQ